MSSTDLLSDTDNQPTIRCQQSTIVICGGGTAGHVTPGIALAEETRNINPGTEVVFLGQTDELSQQLLATADIEHHTLMSHRLSQRRLWMRLKSLPAIIRGVRQARKILNSLQPTVVIGLGGYSSIPGIIAAKLSGYPIVLHEANVIPGLANRLLSRFANLVCVSFAETASRFPKAIKVTEVGIPIRKQNSERLTSLPVLEQVIANAKLILVTGGTIGSSFLNEQAPELLSKLNAEIGPIHVLHQTGRAASEEINQRYRQIDLPATVMGHFPNLKELFAQTDFVFTAGGAITLAELDQHNIPTLVVPLAWSADDHQTWNAQQYCHDRDDRIWSSEADWETKPPLEQILHILQRGISYHRSTQENDATTKMLNEIHQITGLFA